MIHAKLAFKQIIISNNNYFICNYSVSIELFAREMSTNPALAQEMLSQFVDTDHNGRLSIHELQSTLSASSAASAASAPSSGSANSDGPTDGDSSDIFLK